MRFRFGSSGAQSAIGCGSAMALAGLILLTPVGVFLVRAIGWSALAGGLIVVAMGVYYWLKANRQR